MPELEETIREDRGEEFQSLHAEFMSGEEFRPCPAGPSSRWSCVRRIPADLCEARHQNAEEATNGSHFGFDEPQGKWPTGAIEDHQFNYQIPMIPKVTDGPGFLLMNFTHRLREVLLPWYAKQVQVGHERTERPVPGGYLNDEHVELHIVNLDEDRPVQRQIAREMQDVLEWWSGGKPLEHQATFGVRIYQHGNVLLNHVDRADTHIVSAVLQVDQVNDADEGWPLEIISESRDCYEVYLQPGQMVLYEGAKFKHGRPMRFRGQSFANVFSHFRPAFWRGPGFMEL